jgi:ribosomal protein S18 acetylase RimI-like enzyme
VIPADGPDIRPIGPDDIDPALDVLARAFNDDPGALIIEPDPALRPAALRALIAPVVRQAMPLGRVVVGSIGDRVVGIATFLPSGASTPSDDDMIAAGLLDAVAAFPDAATRMGPMVGYLEELHAQAIDGPHARLEFYGVDPDLQGSGVGSRLIGAGHATLDAAGERCYLETFTRRNVGFYERRGYRVVVDGIVPGTGVAVWGLVREPAPV